MRRLRRAALRTFGTVLPGPAAGWFERAILTPPVVSLPAGVPPFEGGRQLEIPYGHGWIVARVWGDGDRAVLLGHGWGGRSESLAAFVRPLTRAGFRVVAYDLPAHGLSDGRRTNLLDCAGAALQLGRAVGPLHAVIAHSFGGPVHLLAGRFGLRYERLALLAPPVSVYEMTMGVADDLGVPRRVSERMARDIAARLRIDWQHLRSDDLVREVNAFASMLIVHDRADRLVPFGNGVTIAAAAGQDNLLATEGLGHRGILVDRRVVGQVVEFVGRPASVPAAARTGDLPDR